MKITVDTTCNMGYIYVKNPIAPGESARTVKVSLDSNKQDNIDLVIDVDINGKILGIEVFGAKRLLPEDVYNKALK